MKPQVTVYTLPGCVQCDATIRTLKRSGVDHSVVDLSKHPDVIERFKAEGHLQAPIVTSHKGTWSGYRPDKLRGLAGPRPACGGGGRASHAMRL